MDKKDQVRNDGYTPIAKGYTPDRKLANDGYKPATGSVPAMPPKSVPKQPSSVQPPKK